MYDVCWIRALGLNINGRIVDTMIAAAVTDENRFRYDLNSLSWKYNGYGKNEAGLSEAAAEWGIDPKSEMYKLPSLNVGSYAERDAEATFGLWQEMKKRNYITRLTIYYGTRNRFVSLPGRHEI